jgi:hypothetical protein
VLGINGKPGSGSASFADPVAHAVIAIVTKMTTTNGSVPGTVVTYRISDNGDGGPRNIFPGASSDSNVWTWNNGFPEFLSFGNPQTLTVIWPRRWSRHCGSSLASGLSCKKVQWKFW